MRYSADRMLRVGRGAREAWAEEARANARDAYARRIVREYDRLIAEDRKEEADAVFDAPAPEFD
jgi:hypothetical protein